MLTRHEHQAPISQVYQVQNGLIQAVKRDNKKRLWGNDT